jgi:hypothetical protein
MRLQEFDLDIRHRKGVHSANVDALTRKQPLGEEPYGEGKIEELYDTLQGKFLESKSQLM